MKALFTTAEKPDIESLVSLMREYYAWDGIAFDEQAARRRLEEFVGDDSLGKALLIADTAGNNLGYVIVTYGYGLEHGKNATIDELYICQEYRGKGVGRQAVLFLESEIRGLNIESIHTEVERANAKSQLFWQKMGFIKEDRYPMVKMLKKT